MKQRYIHHYRSVTVEERSTAGPGLRVPSLACASGEKLNKVSRNSWTDSVDALLDANCGGSGAASQFCSSMVLWEQFPPGKGQGCSWCCLWHLSSQTGQHSGAHTLTCDKVTHVCQELQEINNVTSLDINIITRNLLLNYRGLLFNSLINIFIHNYIWLKT